MRNQLFVQLCRANYDLKKFQSKKEGVGTSGVMNSLSLSLSMCLCACVYMYTYVYMYIGVGTSGVVNPDGAFHAPGDPSFGETTNHVSHFF